MGSDSVQYRFLMAFFQSRTTPQFCGYFSRVHIGMAWPSFACILMTPSLFSTKLHVALVLSSGLSKRKHVAAFNTRELDRELDAHQHGSLKKGGACKSSTDAVSSERLPRTINIQTFKHHSLGDHPNMIRQFGTLDSISTEPVSSFSF